MNTTLGVIAILLLVSLLAGLAASRNAPDEAACAVTARQRTARFLAGFCLWPAVAAAVIFLLVTCWDLIFVSEEDIAELEEMFSE